MKLFKKILAGMLCAALLVGTTACTGGETSSSTPADASQSGTESKTEIDPSTLTIGGSYYDLSNEFFQNMAAATKAEVEKLGYQYKEHDQKNTESEMVTGATNLINEGVAALIISPCKPEALGSIVQAAKDKEIPVVIDDIGGGESDYDVIVISDCYDGGVQAVEYTDKLLKEKNVEGKNVGSITCEPSAVYAARRNQGYEEKMKELGYNIASTICANSLDTEGYQAMKDMLAANPDIVAVFAGNDPMAAGAANALDELKRTDIVLIGFNGDQIALDAIKKGTMAGTIKQDVALMGQTTAQLADKLIRGEDLEYDNADEREIYAAVTLITADDVK